MVALAAGIRDPAEGVGQGEEELSYARFDGLLELRMAPGQNEAVVVAQAPGRVDVAEGGAAQPHGGVRGAARGRAVPAAQEMLRPLEAMRLERPDGGAEIGGLGAQGDAAARAGPMLAAVAGEKEAGLAEELARRQRRCSAGGVESDGAAADQHVEVGRALAGGQDQGAGAVGAALDVRLGPREPGADQGRRHVDRLGQDGDVGALRGLAARPGFCGAHASPPGLK